MWIHRELLQDLVFGAGGSHRFTQDSPVMPDVWFEFGRRPGERHDLLITPARGVSPATLRNGLLNQVPDDAVDGHRDRSREERQHALSSAYDESYVVASLNLDELVGLALPLSNLAHAQSLASPSLDAAAIISAMNDIAGSSLTKHDAWLLRLLGALAWARDGDSSERVEVLPSVDQYAEPLARLLSCLTTGKPGATLLWSINRNRKAEIAVHESSRTIKADAATRLYQLSCSRLAWAVMDTGIDATHPAFRLRTAQGNLRRKRDAEASVSRVIATYDFTRIRRLLDDGDEQLPSDLGRTGARRRAELRRRLRNGQSIDWELLEPLLRVAHDRSYQPPLHPHGTHVAGILAADWRTTDAEYEADTEDHLVGICPDIQLYDFRVLDDNGQGDEFSVLAALQFVRYLNSRNRRPLIQGINLSLSIPHDVSNFACGRTPVCEEATRTQASGVLVVAAAGNKGYVHYLTPKGETEAYQNISITDPGNAEAVLTVGATHRRRPHTYGVSYFSSRGPTGDGRLKPDLVAPGEKILGPVPGGGADSKDGTSMAAPHVSGAAALLMSRHPEFIGEPDRIKTVLCDTATDLGRERYFQGAGLVDASRALQSL